MQFGINTFLFTSPFTNKSARWFDQFAKWGFHSVEIAVEEPEHIDPVYLKERLERLGLSCCAVCACFPPKRDLRGTLAQQRVAASYMRKLIDYASVLGAPSVIGPFYSATGRAEAVPAKEYRRQWKTVAAHLKELAAYAGERGKLLCMEPLNRFETDFINTCQQGLEMIEEVASPALKLLLDTFHMNIEEKDPAAAVRAAGVHLGHIHASASDRGTPGNDHIDWKALARALKSINYSGPISIESFTTDVEVIARAAAIWRKIEPQRNLIATDGLAFLRKTFRERPPL